MCIPDVVGHVEWPSGLKKTKQRVLVLDALRNAKKPLSAQELFLLLEQSGNTMWLSTIYRVLDTLMEYRVIIKAAVHENGMAVYEINDGHKHYAICDGCNRVIPILSCPLESFLPGLKDKNFHVLGHKLQISGYCEDCFFKFEEKR